MRDLLEPLAPEVDVDVEWAAVAGRLPSTPRRSRVARFAGVGLALAIVAVGAVLSARSGNDGGSRLNLPSSGVAHQDPRSGVGVDLPVGWQAADRVITPHLAGLYRPWEVLAVATYPLRQNAPGGRCAQQPVTALEDLGADDALVWVLEPTGFDDYSPRPATFTALPRGIQENSDLIACIDRAADFAFDTFTFNDGGRNYILLVALGAEATAQTRSETLDLVNSLWFGPPLQTYTDDRAGFSVEYPPDWRSADDLLAPIRQPATAPTLLLALAPFPLRADHLDCERIGEVQGCTAYCPFWPNQALGDLGPTDALVWVSEVSDRESAIANYPSRPEEFYELPEARSEECPNLRADVRYLSFVDAGRAFTVYVALGADASDQTRAEVLDIINSLEFEPR